MQDSFFLSLFSTLSSSSLSIVSIKRIYHDLILNSRRTKEQREALKNYNRPVMKNLNGLVIRRKPSKNEKHNGRTTKMLIAVLLLFLITELPHGVLYLLSGILGDCFFRYCYLNFGEIIDILVLLNGTINFILYCLMSRQFRTLFGRLFKPKIMRTRQTTARQTDIQTTHLWSTKPTPLATLDTIF